jgi:hypothetical protein
LGRADVAEQDDRYANLEAQLVGSEAGRVAGVEELGRELSCMCWVGDFVSRGVDVFLSREGRNGLVIEGVHVFVRRSEDGAFDEVFVISVGGVVEGAVDVVDEAFGIVGQLGGGEHEVRDEQMFMERRRRRRCVGGVLRVGRGRGAAFANVEEEVGEPLEVVVRLAGLASCLNTHVLVEVEKLLVFPEVAQAEGSVDGGGLVVVLDDGHDLAHVTGAENHLATERNVAEGGMDVAHEVAEAVVEALEHVSVKHGDLVDQVETGLKEELANGLFKVNGAWNSSAVDVWLLRGLAAGVESGASIHQQSSYTRGGHGESDFAL